MYWMRTASRFINHEQIICLTPCNPLQSGIGRGTGVRLKASQARELNRTMEIFQRGLTQRKRNNLAGHGSEPDSHISIPDLQNVFWISSATCNSHSPSPPSQQIFQEIIKRSVASLYEINSTDDTEITSFSDVFLQEIPNNSFPFLIPNDQM